jgi:hypothetical protein
VEHIPRPYIFSRLDILFHECAEGSKFSALRSVFMGVFIGGNVRKFFTLAALAVVALPLQAKDKPAYEKGVLMQMESSSCGYAEKDGKTLAGEILDSAEGRQASHASAHRRDGGISHPQGQAPPSRDGVE